MIYLKCSDAAEAGRLISQFGSHAAGPIRVLVTASVYRTSKVAMDYIDLPGSKTILVDRCEFVSDDGLCRVTGLPVGNGDRFMGMRADALILIGVGSIPREVLEVISR